jgi:CrcB protein
MEFADNRPRGLMTPTGSVGVFFVAARARRRRASEETMEKLLWAGAGGFIGSSLRYALGGLLARLRSGWTFPVETLVINVSGCVALGLLAGLTESRGVFTGGARVFLFIGVLGGFTTFSAFGYETFQLLRDGQWLPASWSVALQVVLGVGGVWAGHVLSRVF